MIRVVALIRPFANEARQASQSLRATNGLNVLIQNLFGRRYFGRVGGNFDQIGIFRWNTVLISETWNHAGLFGAAMTGVARHGAPAAKLRLVKLVHHQHHGSSHALARNVVGKAVPVFQALRNMAIHTIQTE